MAALVLQDRRSFRTLRYHTPPIIFIVRLRTPSVSCDVDGAFPNLVLDVTGRVELDFAEALLQWELLLDVRLFGWELAFLLVLDIWEHSSCIMSFPSKLLFFFLPPLLFLLGVVGLGQPICQVEQVLWHPNSVQQGSLAVEKLFFWEQLLHPLLHNGHIQDLITVRSQLW